MGWEPISATGVRLDRVKLEPAAVIEALIGEHDLSELGNARRDGDRYERGNRSLKPAGHQSQSGATTSLRAGTREMTAIAKDVMMMPWKIWRMEGMG